MKGVHKATPGMDLGCRVGVFWSQVFEVPLVCRGELGLLSEQPPSGFCDSHAVAGSGPNEVGVELRHYSEDADVPIAARP